MAIEELYPPYPTRGAARGEKPSGWLTLEQVRYPVLFHSPSLDCFLVSIYLAPFPEVFFCCFLHFVFIYLVAWIFLLAESACLLTYN
jgi:hypothetical protein